MHAIAALMLSETMEAEVRLARRHPRRFLNAPGPGFLRSPRFLGLAGRAA